MMEKTTTEILICGAGAALSYPPARAAIPDRARDARPPG